MGYADEVARIQELYLDGRKAEAMAEVPTALIEDIALIGPLDKIREEKKRWEDTVITSLLIQADPAHLPTIAEALA
jgi:hypothetical protein